MRSALTITRSLSAPTACLQSWVGARWASPLRPSIRSWEMRWLSRSSTLALRPTPKRGNVSCAKHAQPLGFGIRTSLPFFITGRARVMVNASIHLDPTEWRTILARLRRAKLLAGEDLHNPGHLDAHPLVREYFSEQLRSQQTEAWKECNRRLYHYYRTLAPQLPNSFREMEPLFSAVICGCHAGLFREGLHEIYIQRTPLPTRPWRKLFH